MRKIVADTIEYIQIEEHEKIFRILVLSVESCFRDLIPKEAEVACRRVEKTGLQNFLGDPPVATCVTETSFRAGLRGKVLLAIRMNDAVRFADLLSNRATEIDIVQRAKPAEICTDFFGRLMEESARHLTQQFVPIACEPVQLANSDGALEGLAALKKIYENVLIATYQVTIRPKLELNIHLLAEPELIRSLMELPAEGRSIQDNSEKTPRTSTQTETGKSPILNMQSSRENADRFSGSVQKDSAKDWNIDLLLDVELPVSVSFGQSEMLLRDVLKLGPGSVIELDRSVNDPVAVIVNHKPIAKGEVVSVEGNFGVRILEVESTADRLRSLG